MGFLGAIRARVAKNANRRCNFFDSRVIPPRLGRDTFVVAFLYAVSAGRWGGRCVLWASVCFYGRARTFFGDSIWLGVCRNKVGLCDSHHWGRHHRVCVFALTREGSWGSSCDSFRVLPKCIVVLDSGSRPPLIWTNTGYSGSFGLGPFHSWGPQQQASVSSFNKSVSGVVILSRPYDVRDIHSPCLQLHFSSGVRGYSVCVGLSMSRWDASPVGSPSSCVESG